ncbi:hypothetical protein V2J09_004239, partial [Rumex salicifolius]
AYYLISRHFVVQHHHKPSSSTVSSTAAILAVVQHHQPLHKPPSLEMSDLWDDVFPKMVTTGKNVVLPSMESTLETQMIVFEAATKVKDEDNSADSLERQMENDKLNDETQITQYLTQQPIEQDTQQPSEQPTQKLAQPPMKNSVKYSTTKSSKKSKKSSPVVIAFEDSCQMVSATSKQYTSAVRNEGSSRATSQETFKYEFKEACEELIRLLNAVIELSKKKKDVQVSTFCYGELCRAKYKFRERYCA